MKKTFLALFIILNALLAAGLVIADGAVLRSVLAALVLLLNSVAYWLIHSGCTCIFQEVSSLAGAIAADKFDVKLSECVLLDCQGMSDSLSSLEETLKNRLSKDEAMLANIVVPMALVDSKGNITWMNESMVSLTENSGKAENHFGKHFSEFFYGDHRETMAEKALREQSKQMAKTEFDTRKGNHKYISVAATPIKDFDGKIIGGFVTVADFTNVVLKERQITEQNQRIAQAVREASEVAMRVAGAAEEMEQRIGQTSQGMQDQRSRTDEVAAAIEEMNATILEVARNAGDAAGTAAKASETTRKGTDLVQRVVTVMDSVNNKAAGLKSEMEDLGKQAQGIGQIMQVISDIADQTNLLALNAAIEAARAGDAGRGFAVVADEVRKLAEKTMTATREVGSYITSIQESTKRNMVATDDTTKGIVEAEEAANVAGDALRQILDYVEKTTDQVRGIATAAEQQSATSEEINRSTHDIHQIAGATAEAMSQAAGAVSQLADLAANLNSAMEHMGKD